MAPRADVENLLRGYDPPSRTQVKRWWRTASVAVDANVLLNLYRYSAETRSELLAVLWALGDRLWIPRRAAEEFARNRLSVLATQRSAQAKITALFERMMNEAPESLRKISSELSRRQGAPRHDERMVAALRQLRDELLAEEERRFGAASDLRRDPLLAEVKRLLRERMGPGLTAEQLDVVLRSGPARYARRIPPGYLDADKHEEVRFGDLIIWNEILERSRQEREAVIFVTDETKEWIHEVSGQTVGPQPLLVRELWDAAEVPLLIYDTARFVDHANRELKLDEPVSEEALDEVRSTSTHTPLGNWAKLIRDSVVIPPTRRLDLGQSSALNDFLEAQRTSMSVSSVVERLKQSLETPPIALCMVDGRTARLVLANAPPGRKLVCSVIEVDGTVRRVNRISPDVVGAGTVVKYPQDFGVDQPSPGARSVTWYEEYDDVRVPLDGASFQLG